LLRHEGNTEIHTVKQSPHETTTEERKVKKN